MLAKKAKAKKAQAKVKAAKEVRKEGREEAGGTKAGGRSCREACRRGSYCLKPEPSSNDPLFYWSPPAFWQEGLGAIA
jgi:hypothetical protein